MTVGYYLSTRIITMKKLIAWEKTCFMLKERCRISDTEIAKLLGIPRTTMNEKLRKIGLKC